MFYFFFNFIFVIFFLLGFKREHLKAERQKNILIITGERPTDETTTKCFSKEIELNDYDETKIELNFKNEILEVKLPKKTPLIPTQQVLKYGGVITAVVVALQTLYIVYTTIIEISSDNE